MAEFDPPPLSCLAYAILKVVGDQFALSGSKINKRQLMFVHFIHSISCVFIEGGRLYLC